MWQGKRNSYIVTKAMKNFLMASVLTLAIMQLNTTVDGIIVSHFVGPGAFSAINLYQPVLLVVTSLYTFLGEGAGIAASRALGERDARRVNSLLSTSLASIIVTGLLLTVLGNVFASDIADLLCKEESLHDYFSDYLGIMITFCLVNMLSSLMNTIVTTEGRPRLVSYSILATGVTNVVLDLLFVGVFGWGVKGSAFATVLATFVNVIILFIYVFSKHSSLRLRPITSFSLTCLGMNMKYGMPFIVTNGAFMVLLLGLNIFIQKVQGTSGLYAMSLCVTLLMIGMMFVNGMGGLILGIGSFLLGMKDVRGVHFLFTVSMRFFIAFVLVVMIVIEVYPGFVSMLFGADTPDLVNYANDSLRVFAPIMPFLLTALVFSSLYQMNGVLSLPPLISLSFPVSLVAALYVMTTQLGNDYVWYAFPISGLSVFLMTLIGSYIVYRKRSDVMQLVTLLPRIPNTDYDNVDISAEYNTEALVDISRQLNDFLAKAQLPQKIRNEVKLCVEEITRNIVQYANRKGHYFDVHVCNTDDSLSVSVMDDGCQFNPLRFYGNEGAGLKILHTFCGNTEYKYMYGLNMTFFNWNK